MTRWVLLVVLLVASCAAPTPGEGAPVVHLHEFSVDATGAFRSGLNDIAVHNQGEFGHTLVIADKTGAVVDATGVIPAGESSVFSVNLEPGTYEFSCRIVVQTGDGTLVDHYHEGMTTTVEVGDA